MVRTVHAVECQEFVRWMEPLIITRDIPKLNHSHNFSFAWMCCIVPAQPACLLSNVPICYVKKGLMLLGLTCPTHFTPLNDNIPCRRNPSTANQVWQAKRHLSVSGWNAVAISSSFKFNSSTAAQQMAEEMAIISRKILLALAVYRFYRWRIIWAHSTH